MVVSRWEGGSSSRGRFFILLLVLLVALTGCAATAAAPRATDTAEPDPPSPTTSVTETTANSGSRSSDGTCSLEGSIPLGAVVSLSGPAAPYGRTIRYGIELAVEEINRQQFLYDAELQMIFKDDKTEAEEAVRLFEGLIERDGVVGILGPTLSTGAFVADKVAQEEGVPVLGTSNTVDGLTDIGEFVFRDSLPESAVIPNTINAARKSFNLKTAFILYGSDDRFTEAGYEVMERAAREQGIRVLGTATFSKGDLNFEKQLAEVKERDPDALMISGLVDEAAVIVIQARQMGIDAVIIGGNGFNSPKLATIAGEAAEGVISGSAWFLGNEYPESKAFVEAYSNKYGIAPDQFAAQSYTGAWLFAHAIRNACSTDPSDIRDALADLSLIPTPLGFFSFTSNRDPLHPPVVLTVQDGKHTLFVEGN